MSVILNFLNSDVAPAWLQAITSVIIIGVTLYVVIFQHNLDRKAKLEEDYINLTKKITSIINLGGGLVSKTKQVKNWLNDDDRTNYNLYFLQIEIGTINNALQTLPIWDMESFDIIVGAVSIQTLSNSLNSLINQFEFDKTRQVNHVHPMLKDSSLDKLQTIIDELDLKLVNLREIEKTRKDSPAK